MQIRQALETAAKNLKINNIKNSHLEAEILLAFILKKPREFVLTYPEKPLTKNQISNIQYLISKRQKGIPIAYLIGQKQFYGLNFCVNKNVLIPRPETELMVEETLKHATDNMQHATRNKEPASSAGRQTTIIDIGTGSGCIIITLTKLLNQYTRLSRLCEQDEQVISNIRYLATDISRPALTVARQNARLHKIDKKITFLHGNLLTPIIKPNYLKNPKNRVIITANLPYLTPGQIKNSPTIKYEPRLALSAGADGLKYYRQLIKQIKKLHSISPAPFLLFFEINPKQTKKIKLIIKKYLPLAKIQTKKDLADRNRLVIVKQK